MRNEAERARPGLTLSVSHSRRPLKYGSKEIHLSLKEKEQKRSPDLKSGSPDLHNCDHRRNSFVMLNIRKTG